MTNRWWLLAMVLGAGGCSHASGAYDPGGTGDYGAIAGGVQDIGYARDVIASGQVPQGDVFPVQGLFGEHDVPVSGAPCEDLLCARPAIGRAPRLLTGTVETWVQLGMSSGLPAPYERPPLDLVIVIDKSGSMSIDIEEVKVAVTDALHQLDARDRVGVIAFDGRVDTLATLRSAGDVDALVDEIGEIQAGGSFDPAPALHQAYDMFGDADGTRLRRVMVFTCGYGLTDLDALVRQGGRDHIGTSVYGVLLGYDPTLGDLLGTTHGGLFHYLVDLAQVEHLFDEDFDFQVSPIAYDLAFGLQMDEAWTVQGQYGVPDDADVSRLIDINTAFLSRRHGAAFLRVAPEADDGGGVVAASRVGSVSLDYVPEPAHGFAAATEADVELALPPDGEPASAGVIKGAALINESEVLTAACETYWDGDADAAIVQLTGLSAYLSSVRDELADPDLDVEIDLVDQLILNMQQQD